MKKIKRCYASDADKNIRSALGYVRRINRTVKLRIAFAVWIEFIRYARNEALARHWITTKVVRRAFHNFHKYTIQHAALRANARRATLQQRHLSIGLVGELEVKHTMKAMDLEHSRKTLIVKRERVEQLNDARERKRTIQKQVDAAILHQQRLERRERVACERQEIEERFQSEWLAKQSEAEAFYLKRINVRMKTSEFKNTLGKREREILRYLSVQNDSTQDEEKENAINSDSIISYSKLDGYLASTEVVPDELFATLRKNSVITLESLEAALVVLCKLPLDSQQCKGMFRDLACPSTKTISIENLLQARRLSNKYIGEEGTLWKMYVCPIREQLVFHNIGSGKVLCEQDVRKKNVQQIVRENMQSAELLKVRQIHYEERCKAYELILHQYAARSIQSMFCLWKARRKIKSQIWVLRRMLHFKIKSSRENAAVTIQAAFRRRKCTS